MQGETRSWIQDLSFPLDLRLIWKLSWWKSFGPVPSRRPLVMEIVQANGLALEYVHESLRKDKQVVLTAVEQNGLALQFAHESLKNDREVVLEAVQSQGRALLFADERFKSDPLVVQRMMSGRGYCPEAFQYADQKVKKDKSFAFYVPRDMWKRGEPKLLDFIHPDLLQDEDIILEILEHHPVLCTSFYERIKNNRELLKEIVKRPSMIEKFVELQEDKELVLIGLGVDQPIQAQKIASLQGKFRSDREVMLAAVKADPDYIRGVPQNFSKDKEFVVEAVQRSGSLLQFVDERFRSDREVVMAAVGSDGFALQYACETFCQDKEIVLVAARHPAALLFAHPKLKHDKELVLKAVIENPLLRYNLTDEQQKDKEILMTALKRNPRSLTERDKHFFSNDKEIILLGAFELRLVAEELWKDKEVVLATLPWNNWDYRFVPSCLKNDRDVILRAIAGKGLTSTYIFELIDWRLRDDREFILEAVKASPSALQFANKEFIKDKEIVTLAVQKNGLALKHADCSLKKDQEIVLLAVKQNVKAFKYADETLKKDKETVLAALRAISGEVFEFMFMDENLCQDREVVIAAVKQNAEVLDQYVRGDLRFDKEIIKIAEQSARESREGEKQRERENKKQTETLKDALREEIKKSRERRQRGWG
eukprot:TRINITY_DN445_c0_g1_i4.p1 TRINITY_DN445_c0_g1~~TRINITY_DN445_c0_g1_i4.p1  ORF type:complete len:675 (-),score=234.72 TRINITY_DN445_c0_g1_i4:619-2577(-)